MQAFLCRVMALVFILNCLLPTPQVLAQSLEEKSSEFAQIKEVMKDPIQVQERLLLRQKEASSPEMQKRLETAVTQQLDESLAVAIEKYENAMGLYELSEAIENLHQLMNKKYQAGQAAQKKIQQEKELKTALTPDIYQKADAIVGNPNVKPSTLNKENEVLVRLAKDDLLPVDLIDYIDPFDPAAQSNLENTLYAGEILGNSLDLFLAQPDANSLPLISNELLNAQLRILHRLNQLKASGKKYTSIQEIMAVGTLRITLWKIHKFYEQTGVEDPLMAAAVPTAGKNTYELTRSDAALAGMWFENPQLPDQQNPYEQISSDFYTEIWNLKKAKPEAGSYDYQFLLTLVNYATTYAMLYNPQEVERIVGLFNDKEKKNDYEQPYTPVISTIFETVFSTVKYLTSDGWVWEQTLAILQDLSDPKNFSIPIRISALEIASLMYGSNSSCQKPEPASYSIFQVCNSGNSADANLRSIFARRTVDLYAPLVRNHYKSYGLDSEQMKVLSDKLVNIYNGFSNASLMWDSKRSPMAPGATADAEGKTLIMNDPALSIPRVEATGLQVLLPNGKVKTLGGFGYSSDGKWIEMHMNNPKNYKKQSNEIAVDFFVFIGNVVFWVYGGEIFTLIGTAYRCTRGAAMALPKAIKAAASANKGRRTLAFSVEIQKGVRFANLQRDLTRNGVFLAKQNYVEKTITNPEGLPVNLSYTAGKTLTSKIIRSQRDLRGKTSFWKWLKDGKKPSIEKISFQQIVPGGIVEGTADVAGTSLSRGVGDWGRWRKLRGLFRNTQEPKQHVFPIALDFPTRQSLQQQLRLGQATTEAARNGAFNLWVPVKTPVYGKSIASEAETSTWWNVTWLGRPGNEGFALTATDRVLITPAISKKVALTKVIDPTKLNGVEVSAQQILNDSWKQTVMNHYFKEVPSKGIGKYILPKYVPNANYWQASKSNWRFALSAGKAFTKNTFFWPRFQANFIFFGAWWLADEALHPFAKLYIEKEAKKDVDNALALYNDTFSPEKLAEDKEYYDELMQQAGISEQEEAPSTFTAVSGAKKEKADGTLITFPILALRRNLPSGLGDLPMVPDADKASLYQNAAQLKQNRAFRLGQQSRKQKIAEQETELREQFKKSALEEMQVYQEYLEQYAAAYAGENSKKEITALFEKYKKQLSKEFETNESLEKQYNNTLKIYDSFQVELNEKVAELQRMIELLNPPPAEQEDYTDEDWWSEMYGVEDDSMLGQESY